MEVMLVLCLCGLVYFGTPFVVAGCVICYAGAKWLVTKLRKFTKWGDKVPTAED
jgi:hypothetical protein